MHSTVVINVVGLSPRMIGEATPNLRKLAGSGTSRALQTVTPAVTCTVQSTFLTGLTPDQHGIVANGWYYRDLSEIWFWRQSNRLVAGRKVWHDAKSRDGEFTCANLFWWYNMYADADFGVTPRPMYPADGRKIPDCYARPSELRDELTELLGPFPLFKFWGPATDIVSSKWIADAALHVLDTRQPTLTLIYLPHLDYNLQRKGPGHPDIENDLRDVDALCGRLMEKADAMGARTIVLSEYGITPVSRPVHINRALRDAGLIQVRNELGREQLDPGASRAFAVSDHQIAHVYVADLSDIPRVRDVVQSLPGVEQVLDADSKDRISLDHPRSGELVAIAEADSWFTYYYWLDDAAAPDFARTVDIHRKPGFDPVELFVDPAIALPKLGIAWRLLKKAAGFRTLMDVIPLDAGLVRGSHGRITDDPDDGPIFISSESRLLQDGDVQAVDVKDLLLRHVFED